MSTTVVENITAVIAAAEGISESSVKETEPAWRFAGGRVFNGPSLEIITYRGNLAVSARLTRSRRLTFKATIPFCPTSVSGLQEAVTRARQNVDVLARAYDELKRAGYAVTPGAGGSPYPGTGLTVTGDGDRAWVHADKANGAIRVIGQSDEPDECGRVYRAALDAVGV